MTVTLRLLQEKDAYTSYRWRNDPEVFRYTGTRYSEPITLDCELNWIRKVIKNTDEYRCAILVENEYVGNIYLTGIDQESAWFHIFIGNKNFWGKGIAKSASKLMIEYGFHNQNLRSIYLTVHPENLAAMNLYDGLGFIKIGMRNGRILMQLNNNYRLKLLE